MEIDKAKDMEIDASISIMMMMFRRVIAPHRIAPHRASIEK